MPPDPPRRRRAHGPAKCAALALLAACSRAEPCATSGDCPAGVCLDDGDRGDRYCTGECASHADCPPERYCEGGLCIERVRDCGAAEECNGLDDDCDGETDDDCETVLCPDDYECGIFGCALVTGPEGGGLTRACMPAAGPGGPGDDCADPRDCYNNICPYGSCVAMCGAPGCAGDFACVTSGLEERPDLGVCLPDCSQFLFCNDGLVCRLLPYCDDRACTMGLVFAVCTEPVGPGGPGDACDGWADCASGMCATGGCTWICYDDGDCGGAACGERAVEIQPGIVGEARTCAF